MNHGFRFTGANTLTKEKAGTKPAFFLFSVLISACSVFLGETNLILFLTTGQTLNKEK